MWSPVIIVRLGPIITCSLIINFAAVEYIVVPGPILTLFEKSKFSTPLIT